MSLNQGSSQATLLVNLNKTNQNLQDIFFYEFNEASPNQPHPQKINHCFNKVGKQTDE